jgi:hypothetical protein
MNVASLLLYLFILSEHLSIYASECVCEKANEEKLKIYVVNCLCTKMDYNVVLLFIFSVWAETGEFRESNHNTMTSVTNMDHTQMNFQTPTARNRNHRERKSDGKLSTH